MCVSVNMCEHTIWKNELKFNKEQNRGFPGGSDGKEFACKMGDADLIPRLDRYPGEGKSNPL